MSNPSARAASMAAITASALGQFFTPVTFRWEMWVRTHISHLKVTGVKNWPKAEAVMAAIDAALAEGLDITFEQYPYTAGSTMMSAILPPWVLEGSTAEA